MLPDNLHSMTHFERAGKGPGPSSHKWKMMIESWQAADSRFSICLKKHEWWEGGLCILVFLTSIFWHQKHHFFASLPSPLDMLIGKVALALRGIRKAQVQENCSCFNQRSYWWKSKVSSSFVLWSWVWACFLCIQVLKQAKANCIPSCARHSV